MGETLRNMLLIALGIFLIICLVIITFKCMKIRKQKRMVRQMNVSCIYGTSSNYPPQIPFSNANDSSVQSTSCDFDFRNIDLEEQIRAYALYSTNSTNEPTAEEYKRPAAYNPNF